MVTYKVVYGLFGNFGGFTEDVIVDDITTGRRETESEVGVKFAVIDPKPGDLSMSRLKVR